MRLDHKVALVTGSGRGLGRAVAILFAREGAKVVVNSVHDSTAKATVDEIKARGGEVVALVKDIGVPRQAQELVQGAIDAYGRLDILINNAGIHLDNFLQDMTEDQFDKVISVNLKGTFMCTQAAAKHMIKQKYGRIVNVSSLAAQGQIGGMNYLASKGGIEGMTHGAALELVKFGITVNAIAPFTIDTDLMRGFSPKVIQRCIDRIPMGRMGSPEEIADVVLFLASDESRYMTGQVLVVDGGTSVYLLQEPSRKETPQAK